jgi:hypothetical protein
MPAILLHIAGEDPILCEVENMPGAPDVTITIKNPRRRDGKDIHYLEAGVTTVVFPMSRVNFIEILPTGEEEEVIGFVRE